MARKRKEVPSPGESPEDLFVPLDEALTRVIAELTEMRVRQRALLQMLDAEAFPWSRYIETVRAVRNRDFDALFNSIVYRQEAFVETFKDWVKEDMRRYAYRIGADEPELVSIQSGEEAQAPIVAVGTRKAASRKRGTTNKARNQREPS